MQNLQRDELVIILNAMKANELYVKEKFDGEMSEEFLAVKAKVEKEIDDIDFETEQKRRAEAEDAERAVFENDEHTNNSSSYHD